MHNLFGDTAAINVELTEGGGHRLSEPARGDTVADLLRYVRFEPDALRAAYREKIEAAALDREQGERYLQALENGLGGYTYLELDGRGPSALADG